MQNKQNSILEKPIPFVRNSDEDYLYLSYKCVARVRVDDKLTYAALTINKDQLVEVSEEIYNQAKKDYLLYFWNCIKIHKGIKP